MNFIANWRQNSELELNSFWLMELSKQHKTSRGVLASPFKQEIRNFELGREKDTRMPSKYFCKSKNVMKVGARSYVTDTFLTRIVARCYHDHFFLTHHGLHHTGQDM